MKRHILSTAVTGAFLALLIVAPSQAQMPGTTLRAKIPFSFVVRGKTLPAGDYEIRRINDSPQGLVMRNVYNTHEKMMFETESVEAKKVPRKTELIFNRYVDEYFLSEIFTGGEQLGRELPPSRTERHLKYESARNETQPETVAVVAY